MWDEENFFETVEAILADDRIPAFQRLRLWEDLQRLEAAWVGMKVETNTPSSRLSLVGRIKSILTANPAYYSFRRGAREAVHKMRIFRSNLGDMRRARLAKGVFEQLLWYLRLDPEKEVQRGYYPLDMRLLVCQTSRRIRDYKNVLIRLILGALALALMSDTLFTLLIGRVQSGVSLTDILLFYLGMGLLHIGYVLWMLSIYSILMFAFYLFRMLVYFHPLTRDQGFG